MSDEDKTVDNSSENSMAGNKRSIPSDLCNDRIPKRPRMNLWEHTKGSKGASKDDTTAMNSEGSASNLSSDESETETEASLEELAANICGLVSSEYSLDESDNFSWLGTMSEAFKNVYLHIRNKACMLWLKDPKNQLIEKTLLQNLNNTSSDKYFQDVIAAKLCNLNKSDENGQKSQSRLNTIDRITLKKYDIDSIIKDTIYKDNISKICVLVIAFLERYGYINFGNFTKHVDSYTTGSLCKLGNPLQVLIIGAGLSGIVAAMQLEYFGCKVMVLEAQDSPGGRLRTFQKEGAHVDVSPFTINGINNPVNQLIKQAGLPVGVFSSDVDIVSVDGDPIQKETISRVECEMNRLLLAANDIYHKHLLNTDKPPTSQNLQNQPQIQSQLSDSGLLPLDSSVLSRKPNNTSNKSITNTSTASMLNSCNITMGEMLSSLLTLQMNHCRFLKNTSNDVLVKLLSRLSDVLDELDKNRADVQAAHDKWWAAEEAARSLRSNQDASSTQSQGQNGPGTTTTTTTTTTSTNNTASNDDGAENDGDNEGEGDDDEDDEDDGDDSTEVSQKAQPATNKLAKTNPEMQMNINLALSDYRRAYQVCSSHFDEAVKLRKMIKLIKEYDPISMLMDATDLQMMNLLMSNLELRVGTDLNNLSVQYVNTHQCSVELASGHIYIKKGFQALINSMVKRSSMYQLNTTVKEINYGTEDDVKLTAINMVLSEDEPVHYSGHVALCTLPLGVLKQSILYPEGPNSPVFIPALPDWKVRAIENLGFGNLIKVVMCFKERFWGSSKNKVFAQLKEKNQHRSVFPQFYALSDGRDLPTSVSALSSDPIAQNNGSKSGLNNLGTKDCVSDVESDTDSELLGENNNNSEENSKAEKPGAVVIGLVYGRVASSDKFAEESDEVIGNRAFEAFKAIFKKKKTNVPDPTTISVIRWSSDPFFGGSLTFVNDSSTSVDINSVAAPLSSTVSSSSVTQNPGSSGSNNTTQPPNPTPSRTRRSAAVAQQLSSTSDQNQSVATVTSSKTEAAPVYTSVSTTLSSGARLFFAGEHTHAQCGSIQAEMLSGLRAATQICRSHFPQWPNAISRMPGNLQFRR